MEREINYFLLYQWHILYYSGSELSHADRVTCSHQMCECSYTGQDVRWALTTLSSSAELCDMFAHMVKQFANRGKVLANCCTMCASRKKKTVSRYTEVPFEHPTLMQLTTYCPQSASCKQPGQSPQPSLTLGRLDDLFSEWSFSFRFFFLSSRPKIWHLCNIAASPCLAVSKWRWCKLYYIIY